MRKDVELYGASGHSKVVIDILELNNYTVQKIYDDASQQTTITSCKVVKPEELDQSNQPFIISIGNNKVRQKIDGLYPNLNYITAIHPKSIIAKNVHLDKGSVVMAGAIINPAVHIGKHCIINTGATIDHDCKIDDYVHISPNATLCGNVTIGKASHIGASSVIIQNVNIGKNVTVGAGSVVIKDIPNGKMVVGNPARIIN